MRWLIILKTYNKLLEMRQILSISFFVLVSFCADKGVRVSNSNLNASEFKEFLIKRVNPLFMYRQMAQVNFILDSLDPYTRSDRGVRAYWLLAKSQADLAVQDFNSAHLRIDTATNLAAKGDSLSPEMLAVKISLASFYYVQDRLDSALKYAHDAYFIGRKRDSSLPAISYRLYEIYMAIGDPREAAKYAWEGYQESKENPQFRVYFINAIAANYESTGLIDSAIAVYKWLDNDSAWLAVPEFKATKDNNIGVLLLRKGRAREAFDLLASAKPVLKQLGRYDEQDTYNYADALMRLGQYHVSLQYLDSADQLAVSQKFPALGSKIWNLRAKNYAALGRPGQGLAAMDSAYAKSRIEMDSSLAKTARDLSAKYSLREKEDAIKSLAYSKKVEENISEQRKIIIAVLVLLIFLIGIVVWLLWRRRRLQQEVREAHLLQQLLRTQMVPHFIFNTLSVLQGFIRTGKTGKSIDFLNTFSKLLRSNLENARSGVVLLADEVSALESYLALQELHFDTLFKYKLSVYSGYEEDNIYVPPMLLQPIVENAVMHGMARLGEEGLITVSIIKEDGILRCIIDDNGAGLHASKEESKKRSLSTIITQERLGILSRQLGKPATIEIIDKESRQLGQGVRVILQLPYREKYDRKGSRVNSIREV